MSEQLGLERLQRDLPELIKTGGAPLVAASADWLAGRSSPATRSAYAAAVKRFGEWWTAKGLRLEDLDEYGAAGLLGEYFASMELSAATVQRHRSAIRTWIDHLIREGFLRYNAAASAVGPRMPPIKDRRHNPALSIEGARRLIASIDLSRPVDRRDHAMILVMFYTGIRVSALVALDVEDLQFRAEGAVLVQRSGKRGKAQEHALAARPLEALLRYLAHRSGDVDLAAAPLSEALIDGGRDVAGRLAAAKLPLFCATAAPARAAGALADSQRMIRHNVNHMLERRCKNAGIAKVSPHSLRAGCGVELRRQGCDILEIQGVMGHADPSTTMIYVRRAEFGVTRNLTERITL